MACLPALTPSPDLRRLVAEGQRLTGTPARERGLAWHVRADFVGDMTALAAAVLRSPPRRA